MRKAKPLGKSSFLRSVLRALGMDTGSRGSALPHTEATPDDSASYARHGLTRAALLEAEEAKGKAIMELQKKVIV